MSSLVLALGINWKILITQVINFGILVAILRWLLYKPLLELLEKRRKKLEEDHKNSEEIARRLAETALREEQTLAAARTRGQKLIADAERAAKALKESLVADARKEAAQVIEAGTRALEEDRVKLAADLRKEIGTVMSVAIEKSLGDVLDAKAQQKLETAAVERVKKL